MNYANRFVEAGIDTRQRILGTPIPLSWTHFLNASGNYDRRWWFRFYVGLTRGWQYYAYNDGSKW